MIQTMKVAFGIARDFVTLRPLVLELLFSLSTTINIIIVIIIISIIVFIIIIKKFSVLTSNKFSIVRFSRRMGEILLL